MNAFEICEALYALPGGVVVERRRPIFKPMIFALLGVVLLVVNIVVVDSSMETLCILLMVLGVGLLGYGVVVVAMRLMSDERVPYHTPSKRYMSYTESYYDRSHLAELQRAVARGDESAIASIETSNVAAITLVSYRATDNSLAAYALYHYVDMEYCLIGEVTIRR